MSDVATPVENQVTIEIDGQEMAVPKGSMIIEAADKAGIAIPRFCYHRKLSIAANCRMCLVDVEKAPKPLPACATPVMDGMKVYTQSKRAMSAQQNVMEFLLINHPLDCPICDQGGECELQDVSMGYGRSVSRFTERKRVVQDENLGSLISTEMTRCIHCTRCVRFLEEIGGTSELGGIGRGDRTMISTFIGRSIDSELSGNIIDLCPVGALTNKPYRFTARAWEMRSRPSVASHDCVGSNLVYHVRHGRIMRAVPRENDAINESWLADRDRWGFHGLYSDDRATEPQVRDADGSWRTTDWGEALDRAAELLRAPSPEDLGFLLSGRGTNEALYLAQKIARALGCNNVDHRLRQIDFSDDADRSAPRFDAEIDALGQADAIFVIGAHPRHEQPILGHRIRQANRAGAAIAQLNAVDYDTHYDVAHNMVVRPARMPGRLDEVLQASAGDANAGPEVAAIAQMLKDAERAYIVLGAAGLGHAQSGRLRALARALAGATDAALCELSSDANARGAWQVGAVPHRLPGGAVAPEGGDDVRGMIERPRAAYLTYDFEPGADSAYGARLLAALAGAKVVHCSTFVTDETLAFADVILPISPAPEAEGSVTNVAGQLQAFDAAGRPPGQARAGWKVLRVLGNALALDGFGQTQAQQVRDEFLAIRPAEDSADDTPIPTPPKDELPAIDVLAEVPIYASDGLVRRSEPLQDTSHAGKPGASMAPDTAAALGVAMDSEVTIDFGGSVVVLPVRIDDRIAAHTVRIPAGMISADVAAGAASVRKS